MKVLFLDFDGVLNSEQEVIWRWRHRKRLGLRLKHLAARLIYSFYKQLRKLSAKLARQSINIELFYLSNHCDFCPIACSNVQYILDEDPEVRIVVSSVWRTWGMFWLRKILDRNGIDASRLIGRTGAWEDGGSQRGDQIAAWLLRHENRKYHVKPADPGWMGIDEAPEPPVTAFAVLDDDSDMDAVKESFVQTEGKLGCTILDARKVLAILNPTSVSLKCPMHDKEGCACG